MNISIRKLLLLFLGFMFVSFVSTGYTTTMGYSEQLISRKDPNAYIVKFNFTFHPLTARIVIQGPDCVIIFPEERSCECFTFPSSSMLELSCPTPEGLKMALEDFWFHKEEILEQAKTINYGTKSTPFPDIPGLLLRRWPITNKPNHSIPVSH